MSERDVRSLVRSGGLSWLLLAPQTGCHCILQLSCFALNVRDAIRSLWLWGRGGGRATTCMKGTNSPLLFTLLVVPCGT